MRIKLLSIFALLCLAVTSAWADGECGDGVTWSYAAGTLTISYSGSGTGAMANYGYDNQPWNGNKADITSIVIGSGVTSIGNYAFQSCKNASLTSITIPAGVTSIGSMAFYNCTGLTSITIPASVTSIGSLAFRNCSGLTSINVDAANANYASEDGALFNKAKTTIIQYSPGKSGTAYTIPASVTSIDRYAFSDCSNLASIEIPASVTSIGESAFYSCSGLTSVSFAPGSQLTTIGPSAFYACYNAGLTSITIPASVTSIGNSAFNNCSNLATVTLNSNPVIGTNAFNNIKAGATVTMNLTANAAGTDYWMTFYNDGYHFKADKNTTVYKGKLNGASLELTEVADKIVTKGNAVILKSTGNPVMTKNSTESTDGYAVGTNDLQGTMVDTSKPANCYTLANGTKGVGFYLYSGTTIHAGKAYLIYTAPSTAREFVGFGDDETTEIKTTNFTNYTNEATAEWYDLQGRRISGKPTKKGVYVRNGQKVVIK